MPTKSSPRWFRMRAMAKCAGKLLEEGKHVADEHEDKDAANDADRQRRCAEPDRLCKRFDRLRDQQGESLPMQDNDQTQGRERNGREIIVQALLERRNAAP